MMPVYQSSGFNSMHMARLFQKGYQRYAKEFSDGTPIRARCP
jgi:hypothetical protein